MDQLHLPCLHMPAQQLLELVHALPVDPQQTLLLQTSPAQHSLPTGQVPPADTQLHLPATQVLAQHSWPLAHEPPSGMQQRVLHTDPGQHCSSTSQSSYTPGFRQHWPPVQV